MAVFGGDEQPEEGHDDEVNDVSVESSADSMVGVNDVRVLSSKNTLLGQRSIGGNCLPVHSGFSWGVVHEGSNGDAANGMSRGDSAHLGEDAGVFEVIICDVAVWVVCRHELVLDFRRERHSPHTGVFFCVAVHSSHARLGGISGA